MELNTKFNVGQEVFIMGSIDIYKMKVERIVVDKSGIKYNLKSVDSPYATCEDEDTISGTLEDLKSWLCARIDNYKAKEAS